MLPMGNIADTPVMPKKPAAKKLPLENDLAARFGALVRERRKALKIKQEDLATTTGVGRRFIIDLEAGKPSARLGASLKVAEALGLRMFDHLAENRADDPLLPAMLDDDESLPP